MKRTLTTCGTLLLVLVGVIARADEESPELVRYKPAVDRSVDRALRWLSRSQRPDGSFPGQHGTTNAVPGLVGMALLSKGYLPGRAPYGHTLNRCVDYVLATPGGNGYLGVRGGRMYGHGIATLFLSEVSGMVDERRQRKLDVLLAKALKIILDAQNVRKSSHNPGGWRYEPTSSDSDLSVSGWSLMALRSSRLNGAPVPADAVTRAIAYVDRCYHASSGGFGYQPGSTSPPMAAVGLLCRVLSGHHADDVNRKCADYLLKSLKPSPGFIDGGHLEYATYYMSQGMFQIGGKYWERFGKAMYDYLLQRQDADGSWRSGDTFTTSMYVLALTVSYRQLPIYQR